MSSPPTTLSARPARAEDAPVLASILARAFFDDPVLGWLMPHTHRRMRQLEHYFLVELRAVGFAEGSVWTTADIAGASITTPPGHWRLPPTALAANTPEFARAFRARLPHATALLLTMEHHHLRAPHHYFPCIGVAPERQGRGLGSELMRPTLELCDEQRLPAYLEASSARSRVLYERLGFEVVRELRLWGSPPLWPMVRQPRPRS